MPNFYTTKSFSKVGRRVETVRCRALSSLPMKSTSGGRGWGCGLWYDILIWLNNIILFILSEFIPKTKLQDLRHKQFYFIFWTWLDKYILKSHNNKNFKNCETFFIEVVIDKIVALFFGTLQSQFFFAKLNKLKTRSHENVFVGGQNFSHLASFFAKFLFLATLWLFLSFPSTQKVSL